MTEQTKHGLIHEDDGGNILQTSSYLHSRHFLIKVETEYTELSPVNVGVPLGPLLYILCTADLPTSPELTTVMCADDSAVLAMNSDPVIASQKLQTNLAVIQKLV
jgi:hypothetical protein